nr:zinc metalloproteinase nas-8-like [Drosophila takahashii]
MGDYFQGDMILPTETRNGVLHPDYRWPGGVVPYVIEGLYHENELGNLKGAFYEYHNKTCVRFIERTTQRDYISIVSYTNGCFAKVGRWGGRQEVHLNSTGCLQDIGTPVHELMHALGFWHEQSRPDRDLYVRVITEHIKTDRVDNFRKYSFEEVTTFGEKYDYFSVMHYSSDAFSKYKGLPTIVAWDPNITSLGQRTGLSPTDVRKINAMYNCRV